VHETVLGHKLAHPSFARQIAFERSELFRSQETDLVEEEGTNIFVERKLALYFKKLLAVFHDDTHVARRNQKLRLVG
jgi:hypothetical protein